MFIGEHVGEARLLIALYGPPLLHVDLKVIEVADLAARVEDGVVLWERDGAVSTALAESRARWPMPDPQWIEDRFWVWIHYAAAKLARGEYFECLDVLAYLRGVVLGPLIAVEHGQRPQGVRRIERYAPERARALEATVGRPLERRMRAGAPRRRGPLPRAARLAYRDPRGRRARGARLPRTTRLTRSRCPGSRRASPSAPSRGRRRL